uniref:DDHD domain-containing protein n=1 Tax=Syphacia muris TaxID=451379 RepID=A0A0N5A9H1_9BILA
MSSSQESDEIAEEMLPSNSDTFHSSNDDNKTPIVEQQPSCFPGTDAVSDVGTDLRVKKPVETMPVEDECSSIPRVPPRSKKRRVSDLRCAEVRWFYRKVGETKWTPFKGRDSLFLEVYWRNSNGVELDNIAKEYISSLKRTDIFLSVVVLDGHYRCSDDFSSVSAIYWKDDKLEIRRGTWFLSDTLQPITPELAEPIEKHHLHYFRFQAIPETPVFSEKEASKKPVLTELKLDDQSEVKWNSVIDVVLYNTSKTSRFLRYITWGKGTALKRGYEEADWNDGGREISHLIFVVHGVGQKGYESLIARNTEQVRSTVYTHMEKNYPDEKSRPMFLPVEWRASLVLDDGLTEIVTLPKMSSVRRMLNSTVLDIMYYQSPLYRKEIMGGLVKSLNRAYSLFIEHHPDYSGPISLFAHSLGSVMCYDILTSWSPLTLYDKFVSSAVDEEVSSPDCQNADALKEFQSAREKLISLYGGFEKMLLSPDEQLKFKVTNLFCVGSPLAVFLIMRGAKSLLPDSDRVKRLYNIFHPYDPVAYRLEPLVHNQYSFVKPLKLFPALDPRSQKNYDTIAAELNKQYIKKMKAREKQEKTVKSEIEEKDNDDIAEDPDSESDDSPVRPTSSCSSIRSLSPQPHEETEQQKSWWKFGSSKKEKDSTEVAKEAVESPLENIEKIIASIPPEKKLQQRIDFQIQPMLTERGYYSLLKSHFSYWTSVDLAAFIVGQLYGKEQ